MADAIQTRPAYTAMACPVTPACKTFHVVPSHEPYPFTVSTHNRASGLPWESAPVHLVKCRPPTVVPPAVTIRLHVHGSVVRWAWNIDPSSICKMIWLSPFTLSNVHMLTIVALTKQTPQAPLGHR